MGGGEDARRRCHCQKTLTPPDEASVDASTHSTAQHTRTHHGQAHTRNTHRDLARTRAGSRATNRAPSTLHTRAAVQPCTLNIGGVAHATHASMRGSAGRGFVTRPPARPRCAATLRQLSADVVEQRALLTLKAAAHRRWRRLLRPSSNSLPLARLRRRGSRGLHPRWRRLWRRWRWRRRRSMRWLYVHGARANATQPTDQANRNTHRALHLLHLLLDAEPLLRVGLPQAGGEPTGLVAQCSVHPVWEATPRLRRLWWRASLAPTGGILVARSRPTLSEPTLRALRGLRHSKLEAGV